MKVPSLADGLQRFGYSKVRPNYMHMSVGLGTMIIILFIYSLQQILNQNIEKQPKQVL